MKRLAIRILVAVALVAALMAFVLVPVPTDEGGSLALPAIALQQTVLYRLEVALAVFYGGLLLITPAFSGLVDGRLPIEISARGAKFADEAKESVEFSDASLKELRQVTNDLQAGLTAAGMEIEFLKRGAGDNAQPRVGSRQ